MVNDEDYGSNILQKHVVVHSHRSLFRIFEESHFTSSNVGCSPIFLQALYLVEMFPS